MATHNTTLTAIGDCERQINSRSTSPYPVMRRLRQILDRLFHEVSESVTRQSSLLMQLPLLSTQQRLEGETSALNLAVGLMLEARNETRRMEHARSRQLFESLAHGARMVVRHGASFYDRMLGQGARIRRVCSRVWGRFRPDLMDEQKEDNNVGGDNGGEEEPEVEKEGE